MRRFFRFTIAFAVASICIFEAAAQSVGINTTGATAHPSAILDVSTDQKGVLIPRMDKTQKNAIATPATGLLIFQSGPDSTGFYYYNGSSWTWLTDALNSDTSGWKITGNSNITASRFLGTLNDSALKFRVNNQPSGMVDSTSFNTSLGYGTLRNVNYAGALQGKENSAFGYQALDSLTTGEGNTANGYHALKKNKTGNHNTAMGYGALSDAEGALQNVAVGVYAGRFVTSGLNTMMGSFAGTGITGKSTGGSNVGLGYSSLYKIESGRANTALGAFTLSNDSSGSFNTAIGYAASNRKIRGNGNIVIGAYTGETDTAANNMVLVGNGAGQFNQRDGIVAIGTQALLQNSIGLNTATQGDSAAYNTAVGFNAMRQNNKGGWNTAVGYQSARNNTTGFNNTAIGVNSLLNATTGNNNIAVGIFAFSTLTTASNNVGLGVNAGRYVTGVSNTYFGNSAGEGVNGNSTGTDNVGIGNGSLFRIQSGVYNVAVGRIALLNNSTGSNNTAIGGAASLDRLRGDYNVTVGRYAGEHDTASNRTTLIGPRASIFNQRDGTVAVGYEALYWNSFGLIAATQADSALLNTAVGYHAMRENRKGGANTAVGYQAAYWNNTGFFNTAIGRDALLNTTASDHNTAVGKSAGWRYNNGPSNTFLGSLADVDAAGRTNTTAIGAMSFVSQDNSMVLGSINGINGATADTKVGIGTSAPVEKAHIANGVLLNTGVHGTGAALAVSGAGSRMFYYPRKSALRAGFVGSTQWDDANIGDFSIALGNGSMAKTGNSIAIGENSIAETEQSAIAIGRGNRSAGFASLAMGHFSEASGHYSAAIGLRDTVSGFAATALGAYNKVFSAAGFAAGGGNTVAGNNAAAFGESNYAPSYAETTVGLYATQYAPASVNGFNAADRVFTVGNGTSTSSRSNALVILKSGNTGIGTTADPKSTLEVDGNIAVGLSMGIAGGAAGSPTSLTNSKYYLGLQPADAVNNNYQLPDAAAYPGRTYIIRNNSSTNTAELSTAGGLLFPGSSSTGGTNYTLQTTTSVKSVMVVSDGTNWSIFALN